MFCHPCRNFRGQLDQSLLESLLRAGFHAQIACEAPTEALKNLIITIVGDEYAHVRIQSSLLGVCPPPITCPPDCPGASGDFVCDVERAIAGELDSIARFAHLASCAPSGEVRALMLSMLGDEYAHARIWSAMLLAPSLLDDCCDCCDCCDCGDA
ncbi:MAG: hypothetical protein ACOYI5_07935 [Christensenellales bacterium]|jgi:hypothetical protein